jgi:HSP20 family molecular chaperone IbpA
MENHDTNAGAMPRRPQGGLTRPASRHNPLYEMQEQMRRMDALFNRVFGFESFPPALRNEFQQMQRLQEAEPDVDIYESDREYILHAALPGIEPQDIQIEATEDSIVFSAQRRSPFDTVPQGGQGAQQGTGQNTTGQGDGTQPHNTQSGQPAQQADVQAGQQPAAGTPSNGTAGTGMQTGAPASQAADTPHTQHRHSRYSGQSRFRLVYTLPAPIDADNVRASFRNGVLELNLPKQRPPASRTVPITIETGESRVASAALGAQSAQPGTQSSSTGGTHEGAPSNKMGSSYTPSGGEDHTSQAQSIGARTDHEPGRQDNPLASGQTNPMGTGTTTTQGAPVETGRS